MGEKYPVRNPTERNALIKGVMDRQRKGRMPTKAKPVNQKNPVVKGRKALGKALSSGAHALTHPHGKDLFGTGSHAKPKPTADQQRKSAYNANKASHPSNEVVVNKSKAGVMRRAAAAKAYSQNKGKGHSSTKPDPKGQGNGPKGTGNSHRTTNPGGKGNGNGHGPGSKGHPGGAGKPGKAGSAGSAGKGAGSKTGSGTTASGYKSKANAAVDLMLNPKINALTGQRDTVDSEYTKQTNDVNQKTARQLSDLSTMYAQLHNTLGTQGQQSQAGYDTAQQVQTGSFDSLDAGLNTNFTNQRTMAQNELQRLGLQGDANTTQMSADEAFLKGLAQTNRAQAAASLSGAKASDQSFNTAIQSSGDLAGTQAQTGAQQASTDLLGNLLFQKNQQDNSINSQIADTQGQRGSLVQQMLQQYEQQAYDRMREQEQTDFMNQMNVNGFNMKQDQFNADQSYRQATLAMDGQRIAQSGRNANAARAAAAQKVASKNGGYKVGRAGAQDYIRNNIKDPHRESALLAILNKIANHTQRGQKDDIHNFSQSKYGDKGKMLRYAYSFMDDPGFKATNGPVSRSVLSDALTAMFGKL